MSCTIQLYVGCLVFALSIVTGFAYPDLPLPGAVHRVFGWAAGLAGGMGLVFSIQALMAKHTPKVTL